MGKIAVSELVTFDWVMEDPGGGEGREFGGWAMELDEGEDGRQIKLEEIFYAEAILMGRVTYEYLVGYWPGRTDELGFAQRLNSLPKYVISSTLEEPEWENTTVLRGDVVEQVRLLKEAVKGDIIVPGSADLVHTLFEQDLLDEIRIMMFCMVLGQGRRLFDEALPPRPMRLARKAAVGQGVAYFVLEPRRENTPV